MCGMRDLFHSSVSCYSRLSIRFTNIKCPTWTSVVRLVRVSALPSVQLSIVAWVPMAIPRRAGLLLSLVFLRMHVLELTVMPMTQFGYILRGWFSHHLLPSLKTTLQTLSTFEHLRAAIWACTIVGSILGIWTQLFGHFRS